MAKVNFKRTGSKRLLKLADFLDTEVPPRRFDMDYWGDGNEKGVPKCGTTACALGWASAVPSLRRAGVKLNSDLRDPGYFAGGSSYSISRKVFGLSPEQHAELFIPGDSPKLTGRRGLRIVARRIRRFVKRKLAA